MQANDLTTRYKIHPAIGIARVGDSPTDIYLAPETEGGLPIDCDAQGNAKLDANGQEKTTTNFKDSSGRVKRQAARFQIYVYDADHPHGREIKIGDVVQGEGTSGKLVDIEWTVWMANKKASWYQFEQLQGEHGYAPDHPLRNADVTGPDRQQLIIDPGSQTVYGMKQGQTSASFSKGENAMQSQNFPPPLIPNSIESLGDINTIQTQDQNIRLIVRGGFGNSGSYKQEFPQPKITHYANNEGWFDDISDGPVTAKLIYQDNLDHQLRYQVVHDPAWVIVGYPSFAPQIVDMVTLDDLIYDLSVREFAYNTYLYGTGNFDNPEKIDPEDTADLDFWRDSPKTYNQDYYPYFYKEIWPILTRPYYMQYTTSVLATSNDAHEIGARGDFDETLVSQPPKHGQPDKYKSMRVFIYEALRRPGEENQLLVTRPDYNLSPRRQRPGGGQSEANYLKELMPLLCGDNPLTNTLPSKFLRLTDTQLFLLKQWAEGKFINEKDEDIQDSQVEQPVEKGTLLDRGVLSNGLGGAFCPGAEVAWIVRNPAIYSKPYRIKIDHAYTPNLTSRTVKTTPGVTALFSPPDLSTDNGLDQGMQPGDLTKYSALPWQSDFNECSDQNIDVTYDIWNNLYPDTPPDGPLKRRQKTKQTLWWPSHRPMQVWQQFANHTKEKGKNVITYSYDQVDWARGIPATKAGDYKMVTEWSKLGFVVKQDVDPNGPAYVETEAEE